ncbi:MAG: right-handed parallel beta-helix repeat-containing protein, partial [Anaerolineales bacterium]|nr:right-handed parallel beta-helix repeat-containing protein [Anaerolineales bacterium]
MANQRSKFLHVWLVLALLLGLAVNLVPFQSARAATLTLGVDCGPGIQDCINVATAGDTIVVPAGVYPIASTIVVNKPLTLQGPQANVDPRPSAGSARLPGGPGEAILDGGGTLGVILRVQADNVTINGFEIRNGTSDLVDSQTSSGPFAATDFKYNIVRDAVVDEGVQLRNIDAGYVQYNYVYNTKGDGINMCCGSVDGFVQYNEVANIYSSDGAIYLYDTLRMTIQENLVYNQFNNDGIKLGNKGGGDAGKSGGWILNNVVYNTAQDGITLYMSGVVIDGNEVYNSSSINGAIHLGYAISNITIQNNHVHDNSAAPGGIALRAPVQAATVTMVNNCLVNNSVAGVWNDPSNSLLVAENNWWGDASGPSTVGPGSGDAVSTNVDFDPWLTSDPCSQPPPPVTETFSSYGYADGWVLERAEDYDTGYQVDNKTKLLRIGDDRADRQYKTILSFDTSGLPAGATVVGLYLDLRQYGLVGDPFATLNGLDVEIVNGFFSSSWRLERQDFETAADAGLVGVLASAPGNGNWVQLDISGLAAGVNLAGDTQLRLSFNLDDDDDRQDDYWVVYGGYAGSSAPVLVV